MTEREEAAYLEGQRAAARAMVQRAFRYMTPTKAEVALLTLSRVEAKVAELCCELGVEYEPELDPSDMLDEVMHRHLFEVLERARRLLKGVEWIGSLSSECWPVGCPDCALEEHEGHSPDCEVAAVLELLDLGDDDEKEDSNP